MFIHKEVEEDSLEADDSQIVARVLAGETSAYRHLVGRHQQSVFRFAWNLIGDEHEAEDIAQEVFVTAFSHLESYDSQRAALQTWLLTITRNRCINLLKRKRPTVGDDAIRDKTESTGPYDAEREEFWRELTAALARLPLKQKTAFVLAEIEQLSYAEIAKIEQTTCGTVKSRIHRAKQRLRAALRPTRR
jgi:RNA polymerase sigma-70 factor (ECF subfamily)